MNGRCGVIPGTADRKRSSRNQHSTLDIRKRKSVTKAVPKGSGLTTEEWTDLTRGVNDDVVAIETKRSREKMTRIINGYDQRDMQSGESPASKVNSQNVIQQGGGTVLVSNWNTHSQRWDPKYTERRDAMYCEKIMDVHGLEIDNNDRPSHYWTREGSECASIVDLTLGNRVFTKWTILAKNRATGSNNKIIE